ncbi:protein JINGUBANG-like [Macadamia integrifolia]|uniref:protein JINGUBANG-like n=1 Tax=Macadamia integrifolia TaxID=60698 RepID=UPI001C4E91BB|nr:protein JINGUBANG-like [Macadamia integrifolia]
METAESMSMGLHPDEHPPEPETTTNAGGRIIPTKVPSFSDLPLSPARFSFSRRGPPSSSPLDSITESCVMIGNRGREASNSKPSFFRSISTKEPSLPPDLSLSPARFSFSGTTCPQPLLTPSPPPSPRPQLPLHHSLPLTPTVTKLDNFQVSHRCISSTLKKDGRLLSMGEFNGVVYTGSENNCIRIWKLPDYTECGQLKTRAHMVCAMAVSKDRVFAAYADCKIRVWRRSWDGIPTHVRIATIPKIGSYIRNYIAGKDKKTIKHLGPITSLAIHEADDLLYSASVDKTVKVWRISDLKCIQTIQAHPEPINAIVVGDDDGILYTASDDATVRVWRRNFCSGGDRQQHALTVSLSAKYSPVKDLTLVRDGGILYGGCTDGYIHYWFRGWVTGQLQYGGALSGHSHAVMCLANVANYVVSGSADLTSRVWARERDGQHVCLAVLQGHRGPVRCVTAFLNHRGGMSEDGEDHCTVCTGSLDGVLKVWQVKISGKTSRNSTGGGGGGGGGGGQDYFDL